MENKNQYSIPLIFKKIMNTDFTGELILKGENYTKNLYFKKGNLIFAKSELFNEKLGVLLFLLGKISEEQYEHIGGLAHSVDQVVGDILIQNNFITEEDLLFARIHQIKKIAVNSFLIKNLEYKIKAMEPSIFNKKISIPLLPIIIEGVRNMKDLSFFKKKIQFHSPITLSIPNSLKEILTVEEKTFYNDLKKCKKMSNHEIISALNLNPEKYWNQMFIFILLEIIDFQEHTVNYDINEEIHELIEFDKKLNSKEANYYTIFGIDKNASIENINSVYEKISNKFDKKKFGSALAPELKQIAESVSSKTKEIYQKLIILHNKNKKNIKKLDIDFEITSESSDKEIKKKVKKDKNKINRINETINNREEEIIEKKQMGNQENNIKKNLSDTPIDPYQIAEDHYKKGNYQNAIDILKKSVRGSGKGESYYLLGLSQSHNEFYHMEAEMNLKKAIELNPWSSDPIYSLGMLYKKQDKKNLAKRCFERVLSMTVDHQDAVRAIQDLYKKKNKKSSIFSILKKDIKLGSK